MSLPRAAILAAGVAAIVVASTFTERTATADPQKDCDTLLKDADELMGISVKSVQAKKKSAALSSAAGANKRYLDAYFECLPDAAKVKRAHEGVIGAHEAFEIAHRLSAAPAGAPAP